VQQAEPMQPVGDGRERLHRNAALRQSALDLTKRDALLLRRHRPEGMGVGLEQRTAIASDLGRCGAASLAHPLHQLDGGRRAYRKAFGRSPDRAAVRHRPNNPLAKIAG
jgi:hypothetical protein